MSEVMGLMTILLFGSAETTSGLMSTFFKLLAENPTSGRSCSRTRH
jgi:cytochrome P450